MRVTEQMNERRLLKLIDRWQASGRIAIYHPRKQTVSISGGHEVSVMDAITAMEAYFDSLCELSSPEGLAS